MHQGRTVFAQLTDYLPRHQFNQCVERYQGNHRVRRMSCWDQYLIMTFAQLTALESLREIELGLRVQSEKLYTYVFCLSRFFAWAIHLRIGEPTLKGPCS